LKSVYGCYKNILCCTLKIPKYCVGITKYDIILYLARKSIEKLFEFEMLAQRKLPCCLHFFPNIYYSWLPLIDSANIVLKIAQLETLPFSKIYGVIHPHHFLFLLTTFDVSIETFPFHKSVYLFLMCSFRFWNYRLRN
jgi:hypothetical protein